MYYSFIAIKVQEGFFGFFLKSFLSSPKQFSLYFLQYLIALSLHLVILNVRDSECPLHLHIVDSIRLRQLHKLNEGQDYCNTSLLTCKLELNNNVQNDWHQSDAI